MDTENTILQKLMNSAYDKWQQHDEWSMSDFHENITAPELFAVRVGNLNYQVENGGFEQWMGNDYATTATLVYLRRNLENVGDAATVVKSLLRRFEDATTQYGEYDPRHYSEEENEEIYDELHELDGEYYKINEQFIQECEEYLAKL